MTYTVRQHFMKNETKEDGAVNIIDLSAAKDTPISQLIAGKEKDQTFEIPSQTYLYDNTKTKVNSDSYVAAISKLETSGSEIDLYYYLDENKDDVPDYKQIFISYQSSNLLYGTVMPEKKVAITLDDSNKDAVIVTDQQQAGTATPKDNFEFVKWVKGEDGEAEAYSESATLNPTITTPVGGATYVFTAVFKDVGQDMGTLDVTKEMDGKEFEDLSENFALLVKDEQGRTAATLKLQGDAAECVYVSAEGH